MATNPFLKQLSDFYRAARHPWGRCPPVRGTVSPLGCSNFLKE